LIASLGLRVWENITIGRPGITRQGTPNARSIATAAPIASNQLP